MGHANTRKHKAMHGGYRKKPGKKEVQANLDLWEGLSIIIEDSEPIIKNPRYIKSKIGTQLKLNI